MLRWSVAGASSLAIGLSSCAIVYQNDAPERTIALRLPPQAKASGNLAARSFAARSSRASNTKVSPVELDMAIQSYRGEPLSATAVAIIASGPLGLTDSDKRWRLLNEAGKLTRRNSFVSSALIDSAGRRNDSRKFFTWLSRAMLTNVRARQLYGAAMADATSRPDAVPALVPILGASPRWARYYWQLVTGRPASLANAGDIRLAITQAPWRRTEILSTDQLLLAALVRAQQFDKANRLYTALNGRASPADQQGFRSDFNADPRLAPLDWLLSANGNLGASIDTKGKRLAISALGGANGAVARRLVRLQPGAYTLGWSLPKEQTSTSHLLSATIYCAEKLPGATAPVSIPLSPGVIRQSVIISNGDCRWYWLSINAAVRDDSSGVDLELQELFLSPASSISSSSSDNPKIVAPSQSSDYRKSL